jgi:PAS domain S-box-containing protein
MSEQANPSASAGASVLIVDDDENSCRTLTLIFAKSGYETATARTGREAIEQAKERPFNLALLDIRLPDVAGVELIAPLKEMHPDLVVIMVTAFASLETAVRALNYGASAYITKPLNMDEVLATGREALEKQRLVMENRRLFQEAQRELAERRRAEQALQESEGKLVAMLQSIGDHLSMIDKDLNIIWANKVARRVFGSDIVGEKCYEAYHQRQEPCEPYPCITLRAFQDGGIHEHDIQAVDKDGRTMYLHCTANVALTDSEGKPTAVIEISRDITDRRLAEEERDQRVRELEIALANVRTLRGLVPICASCKKIRDDDGYWQQVEVYIRDHADVDFSHGLCPDCLKALYPELFGDEL